MIGNINVISGPKEDINIPVGDSLGKIAVNALKRKNATDIAMVDALSEEAITFRVLLESSVKLALKFKALGIKKDDVVGIASENHLEYFIPILASWYLGVIVHPLNPAYTVRELLSGYSLSNPKMIFCSNQTIKTMVQVKENLESVEYIVSFGGRSEDVQSLQEFIENEDSKIDDLELESFDNGQQVAILLCSSGTTGLPKCVTLTHQNLRTAMAYLTDPIYCGISSELSTVVVVPFFHVFGLLVQWASITYYMKVYLLPKFKPELFLKTISDNAISKLFVVPPLMLFLAKSPIVDNFDLSSLKDIMCGAAPLSKEIQDAVARRLSVTSIRQIYGLTELSGAATIQPYGIIKNGSAGILVPKLSAKVCDPETSESLGPRKIGELCFKGAIVMKGYMGNTDATKATVDEDGFLHSGDLGYYDEEGYFFIVDRLKELIKYKGFQVPPAELEAILLTHPAVKDVGVIGIPDERAGEKPLAFIVRQNDVDITEQDLVEFVAEHVSAQKRLYGGVRFVDSIPKSDSGKILRRKLREIYNAAS